MTSLVQTEDGSSLVIKPRRYRLGTNAAPLRSPSQQWAVGTMVSFAAFYVAAMVSLCGNTAAVKKLAYVTVVSSICCLARGGLSVFVALAAATP